MKAIQLAAVTLFTFASAWADKHPPMTFEQIDANSDGYISQKEAKARKDLNENWKNIDTNADGKINSEEFIAYESRNRFEPPDDSISKGIGASPTPE
jgi:Ca2+-binding EF-hand superfamily protein